MYKYIKWNAAYVTGVLGTQHSPLPGGDAGLHTPAWGGGRGPKGSPVGVHVSRVSSVTENLEFTSDFYGSKSLATLCLPIGSSPGGTFSKNGGRGEDVDEEGRQEI